jgi:hypothetical protein
MGIIDTGGFDIAIEIAEELMVAALGTAGAPPLPPDRTIQNVEIDLTVHSTAVKPTGIDIVSGEVVRFTGTYAAIGTVTRLSIGGTAVTLSPALNTIALTGTYVVPAAAGIGTVGGATGVVLTPNAAASTIVVDEAAFFASPPIQLILAAAFVSGGEAGYQQRRSALAGQVNTTATLALRASVGQIPPALVMAQPVGVTFSAVHTTPLALKVLAVAGGKTGTPSLTTMTVRRNATGGPLDLAALVADNAWLLGTLAKPAAAGALGIGAGSPPFFAGHPCLLVTPTPLTLPAGTVPTLPGGAPAATVFVDFLHGFVNNSGLFQLDVTLRAVAFATLATITTSATVTASFAATVAAGTLTVGLGTPAFTSMTDVSISPVVYILGGLLGGSNLLLLFAVIDLFAGAGVDAIIRLLAAPVLASLALTITFPLGPPPFTALTPFPVESIEALAPTRTVAFTGPGGTTTVVADRAHDVTVRLF